MRLTLSPEIQYMLLVFGLFIVPKALQRFRIPSAVTCLLIGATLTIGFDLFHDDHTVKLLSTLGIVALFLFAGLEVDFGELRQGRKVLLQHIVAELVLLAIGAMVLHFVFGLELRAALLFALALLTPSTGFILDSLQAFGLSVEERFWVKSKAIASELVALGILFLTIQSADLMTLIFSALGLTAMVHLRAEQFSWSSLAIAVALLIIVLPVRVFRVAAHRVVALSEPWRVGARVGIAVLPTLVFTIVIAGILLERYHLSPTLFGALIIFTVANTLLPGLLLRLPVPEFDTPEAPRPPEPPAHDGGAPASDPR